MICKRTENIHSCSSLFCASIFRFFCKPSVGVNVANMKFASLVGLVAWSLWQIPTVSALSNITFYSDDSCQKFQGWKTGPDDGTCTQFPTNVEGYLSYMVTSLDQTCAGKYMYSRGRSFTE
jgi:hypothetical protein